MYYVDLTTQTQTYFSCYTTIFSLFSYFTKDYYIFTKFLLILNNFASENMYIVYISKRFRKFNTVKLSQKVMESFPLKKIA